MLPFSPNLVITTTRLVRQRATTLGKQKCELREWRRNKELWEIEKKIESSRENKKEGTKKEIVRGRGKKMCPAKDGGEK